MPFSWDRIAFLLKNWWTLCHMPTRYVYCCFQGSVYSFSCHFLMGLLLFFFVTELWECFIYQEFDACLYLAQVSLPMKIFFVWCCAICLLLSVELNPWRCLRSLFWRIWLVSSVEFYLFPVWANGYLTLYCLVEKDTSYDFYFHDFLYPWLHLVMWSLVEYVPCTLEIFIWLWGWRVLHMYINLGTSDSPLGLVLLLMFCLADLVTDASVLFLVLHCCVAISESQIYK